MFEDWTLRYSMPSWLIEMWKQQYPAETVQQMLESFLKEQLTTAVSYTHLDVYKRQG